MTGSAAASQLGDVCAGMRHCAWSAHHWAVGNRNNAYGIDNGDSIAGAYDRVMCGKKSWQDRLAYRTSLYGIMSCRDAADPSGCGVIKKS